jgi:DnaJ-domain-containing protein 1
MYSACSASFADFGTCGNTCLPSSPGPPTLEMPLTRERIEAIRDELLCEDLEYDFEELRHWSEERIMRWFEAGGSDGEPHLERNATDLQVEPLLEANQAAESSASSDSADSSDDDDDDDDDDGGSDDDGSAGSYYALLGLPRGAGDEAIKRAYRKAAIQWHPDKNPGQRELAERRFKQIAEAYEILSNPHTRRVYDSHGHTGLAGSGHTVSDPNALFAQMMAGMQEAVAQMMAQGATAADLTQGVQFVVGGQHGQGPQMAFKVRFQPPGSTTGEGLHTGLPASRSTADHEQLLHELREQSFRDDPCSGAAELTPPPESEAHWSRGEGVRHSSTTCVFCVPRTSPTHCCVHSSSSQSEPSFRAAASFGRSATPHPLPLIGHALARTIRPKQARRYRCHKAHCAY